MPSPPYFLARLVSACRWQRLSSPLPRLRPPDARRRSAANRFRWSVAATAFPPRLLGRLGSACHCQLVESPPPLTSPPPRQRCPDAMRRWAASRCSRPVAAMPAQRRLSVVLGTACRREHRCRLLEKLGSACRHPLHRSHRQVACRSAQAHRCCVVLPLLLHRRTSDRDPAARCRSSLLLQAFLSLRARAQPFCRLLAVLYHRRRGLAWRRASRCALVGGPPLCERVPAAVRQLVGP